VGNAWLLVKSPRIQAIEHGYLLDIRGTHKQKGMKICIKRVLPDEIS
jgi:hypothetical protein